MTFGKSASEPNEKEVFKQLNNDVRPPRDFIKYDKLWLKNHFRLSFKIAVCMAIANATFYGMFSKFSEMALDKSANKEVKLHKIKTPAVMGGMMGMGVCVARISTKKEAERQMVEDNRLAHRIAAGKEASGNSDADQPTKNPAYSLAMLNPQSTRWRRHVIESRQEEKKSGYVLGA